MAVTRKEFIAGTVAVATVGCGCTTGAIEPSIVTTTRKEGAGMLKGISPVISPDLLKVLAEMGHGDEIVISDANFPAHTFGRSGPIVLRADGIMVDQILAGMIPLMTLDVYATPVVMMHPVPGDKLDPAVEVRYRKALNYDGKVERMERFSFYERAKKAYAIVLTGDHAIYGNVIIKKGIIQ